MTDSAIAQRAYWLRCGPQVMGVVLFLAAFFPRAGFAQQGAASGPASVEPPEVAQARMALRSEYERRRFLNAASGNGGDNLDSAVLVESAQTLPPGTWSPSLGVSSTKGTYKFPLTLAFHPPTPTGNGDLRWRFAQSEIAGTYSPTQVKPMTPSTQLETSPTKMGTLSYKFPLVGRDETADRSSLEEEMATAFKAEVLRPLAAVRETDGARKIADLVPAVYAVDYLNVHDTPPRLKIDLKLSYDWDHSAPTPNVTLPADYFTAWLLASKSDIGLVGRGRTVVGFLTTLSNAWFRSLPNQAAYKRDEIGVGGEIGRKSAFYFGLQGTYDHYSGAGFNGLRGVTDAKLRDDVSLAEIIRFAVPGGHKLEVSVKEMHTNTANLNLMVIATTTFKFPPLKASSPGLL